MSAHAPLRPAAGSGRRARLGRLAGERPVLVAALVYLAVVLVFLGPALLPGKTLSSSDTLWFEPPWLSSKPPELTRPSNPELGDATEHLQLFLRGDVDRFPHVPLWNPAIQGGRPFLANLQSGFFSPFSLPAYVLPFLTALGWIAVLKLWLAALGTFVLARTLGMRFGGALLAGLIFALNLKCVTWVIYANLGIWALMPWLLVLTDRLVRRPDLLAGAGVAALVALSFLTGHPETSFHSLLAAGAFFALRLWQRRGDGGPGAALRTTGVFAAGVLGGAALAALTLIPFAELLWHSADIHDRAGASVDVHLPLQDLIGALMPDYWGRPTETAIRPILLERAMYVGALPLLLAAAALILRPTRERVAVALFGALWLCVVVGIPPVVQIVTRLPVFSSGHNTRLIVLAILPAALLAGWGLDDLAERAAAAPGRVRAVLIAAGVIVLVPVVIFLLGGKGGLGDAAQAAKVALMLGDPPGGFGVAEGEGVIRLAALLAWLALAGAGLALIAARTRFGLAPAAFVALALLLVTVDLFRIGMGYNPAIDRSVAEQPATGAVRYLERRPLERFVSTDDVSQNVIPMRFGLEEARGYDLPIIRRYDRLWRQEVVGGDDTVAAGLFNIPLRFTEPSERALRTLRLLGVTHILQGKATFFAEPDRLLPLDPLRAPGIDLAYDGADARVYRVSGALPRVFVVGGQRVVGGGDGALAAVTEAGFDGRRVAVTERRVGGVPVGGGGVGGEARVVSYEPERVVVEASSAGAGMLVLGDNWFPGWKAWVDGREVPVERVDYVFRGVPLAGGEHTVEFRYEPLSWRVGWIVSLVSLLGLVAALAIGTRRRRNA
ncbi:MAG: YfhO family protein, partial [Thermoleophilaceae bacterium]|nr:YfhO family protein [Thermoleophilaceae bacterium]